MVTAPNRSCRVPHAGPEPQSAAVAAPRALHRMPPALAIAGMHRSGTSFVASLFDGAGISLGGRLLGVGHGNPRGHFEDLDFLELHQQALRCGGFHGDGIVPEGRIEFPTGLEARAGEIVAARRAAGVPWGWKDPRTVLYLDFWAEQVPEATWLIIFRSPWEVADSLYRRLDEACITEPLLALRAWEHANRLLLDFARRRPERCLVRELGQVIADPAGTFTILRDRFGLPLAEPPRRFEADLLGGDAAARGERAAIVRALLPEVDGLYLELRDVAGSGVPLPTPWRTTAEPEATLAAVATWARASRDRTIAAASCTETVAAVQSASDALLADERARGAETGRMLAEERARGAELERMLAEERARGAETGRMLVLERERFAESERMLAAERALSADALRAARDDARHHLAVERDAGDRRFVAEREIWEARLAAARAETAALQEALDASRRNLEKHEAEHAATVVRHRAEIESSVGEIRRLEDHLAGMAIPRPKLRTLAKLRREATRVARQLGAAVAPSRPSQDSRGDR